MLERTFKGLLPAVDRRQPVDKFVLNGKNFSVDVEGPKSDFGSDLITYEIVKNAEHAYTFRVQNEIFMFTNDAVLTYDVVAKVFIPINVYTVNTQTFPWTHAIVGGVHYFLKRGGVIHAFNPATKLWTTVTANVITDPHYLTASAGRLIVMGINDVQNSAIDDGVDLATDIEKKVGIQSLAIVGGGTPLALLHTSDGFIAYTNTGAMIAEIVDAATAFRVFPLADTHDDNLPISRFTITEFSNDAHVLLSRTGLYLSDGKRLQQFQPLMSEFIVDKILPNFDLEIIGTLRLTYQENIRRFFVSIAETEQAFMYTKAFMLYVPRDEWGVMDKQHIQFGELTLQDGPFKGFNFGYFCFTGCLHTFTNLSRVEAHPDGSTGAKLPGNMHLFHTDYFIPSRIVDTIAFYPTVIQMETFDESVFIAGSGLYEFGDVETYISPATPILTEQASEALTPVLYKNDLNMQAALACPIWALRTPIFGSVDSFIDVGLFAQKTELDNVDEMTLVTDVNIGMLESPSGQIFEDWLTFEPELMVDWLDDASDEDWGAGVFSGTVYISTIIGSLDGENTFQDQLEIMEEREDIVDADLFETTGKVKYFTCYNNGFYHIVRIEALNVDESFHLKTLDLLLKQAGQI